MYEDLGYDEKLLGILMIASHLKRSDCVMWVKTGNLAVKLKDYRIAIHCISKGELSVYADTDTCRLVGGRMVDCACRV